VGLKGSAGIVSGTLGIFYQKYDGFQVSVIQPDGRTVTQSAGTASNLGVEAEVSARVTRWMSLFGNVAYIDGGIDENQSFAPAFSGARFRLQPEWQSAAGFTVDAPVGNGIRVFATPSITYRSRIFFELPNNPRISQDAVTLLNVRGGRQLRGRKVRACGFPPQCAERGLSAGRRQHGRRLRHPDLHPGRAPLLRGAADRALPLGCTTGD
jgi:outer membrane receptor protein involved in Fe transport